VVVFDLNKYNRLRSHLVKNFLKKFAGFCDINFDLLTKAYRLGFHITS
jgi:hypothetical protein